MSKITPEHSYCKNIGGIEVSLYSVELPLNSVKLVNPGNQWRMNWVTVNDLSLKFVLEPCGQDLGLLHKKLQVRIILCHYSGGSRVLQGRDTNHKGRGANHFSQIFPKKFIKWRSADPGGEGAHGPEALLDPPMHSIQWVNENSNNYLIHYCFNDLHKVKKIIFLHKS